MRYPNRTLHNNPFVVGQLLRILPKRGVSGSLPTGSDKRFFRDSCSGYVVRSAHGASRHSIPSIFSLYHRSYDSGARIGTVSTICSESTVRSICLRA